MRSLILTFFIALCSWAASAQTVYYSTEFNGSPDGWTVNTTKCGTFAEAKSGSWALQRATVNGTAVSGLVAELNIYNPQDYSVSFSHGPHSGFVQARHTITAGKLVSSMNGATLALNGYVDSTQTTTDAIIFTSNLKVDSTVYANWARTLIGV